jgi:hypothetical protein
MQLVSLLLLLLLPLLLLLLLQAPEQASNGAGRLDFCLDSWGLGLLLLCLRRGKRPFWWLQVGSRLCCSK